MLSANVSAAAPDEREAASILVFENEFRAEFGFDGTVSINQDIFPGEDIVVTITDADGNLDDTTSESLAVQLENVTTGELAFFFAFEDGNDSSTFIATFPSEFGLVAGSDFDITMVVQAGDVLEATYTDEVDSDGDRDTDLVSNPMLTIQGGDTAAVTLTPATAIPGSTLTVQIVDTDLDTTAGADTFDIEVTNVDTGEVETITLTETGGSTGTFDASFGLTFDETGGPEGDGNISGEAGDTIRVDYNDQYTDNGNTVDINDSMMVIGGNDGSIFITPSITVGDPATLSVTDNDLTGPSITVVVENIISGEVETVTLNQIGASTTYENTLATSNLVGDSGDNSGVMRVLAGHALIATYSDILLTNGGSDDFDDQCSVGGGVTGTIEVTPSVSLPGTITIVVTDPDQNKLPPTSPAEVIYVSGVNLTSGESEGDLATSIALTESFTTPDTFVGTINVIVSGGAPIDNDGVFEALANEIIRFTYNDPLDNAGGSTSTATDDTQVGAGQDGELNLGAAITPGENLQVTVLDGDLNENSSLQETATVVAENRGPSGTGSLDSVTITVTESNSDSSSFFGLIPTVFEDTAYEVDSVLEVQTGDVIEVRYIDALTDVGPSATRTETSTVLGGNNGSVSIQSGTTKPTQDIDIRVIEADIDNPGVIDAFTVTVENLTTGEAEVIAVTEPADGVGFFDGTVATQFGLSAGPSGDFTLVVSQGDQVRVTYVDELANNGGQFDREDTITISGGDSAAITLSGLGASATEFLPRDPIGVSIIDTDLDADPGAPDVINIRVSNVDSTEFENVFTLTETGLSTGEFVGEVPTLFRVGAVVNNNGVVGVTVGETVRISFDDALTDEGDSATVTADISAIQRVADVSISVVSVPNPAAPGGLVNFDIVVANVGPHDAPDNVVSGVFSDLLSDIVWTCLAGSPASNCSAAGVNGLADTTRVAAGDSVTFSLRATADISATGPFSTEVSTQVSVDVNDTDTSNNSATDENTLSPQCGDPFVTPDEECDDGNSASGDGCSAECTIEEGWSCSSSPSVCQFCGNGQLEGDEACDDGNDLAGDGCDACETESGYVCNGVPSACVQSCGNGVINLGEECDDGDTSAGDGCDGVCRIEAGYACVGAPSVCTQDCGNSSLNPGEECDDGDLNGGDGCSPSCRIEPGWACAGVPSNCTALCGNATLDVDEECDDGNAVSTDGCSASCEVEDGYACDEASPSNCSLSCGDGVVDATEECDDGSRISFDGCSSICRIEPGYVCAGNPSLCLLTCGNSVLDGLEACDDGNLQDDDGCSKNCTVETGFSCDASEPSQCSSTCGDSIVVAGEECDSGINGDDSDGCSDLCEVVDGYVCTGSPSVCVASCGDAALDFLEECDDGNLIDGDGCSATCETEPGYTCFGAPSDCLVICGDAAVTTPEECDDANVRSGDGCSDACVIEDGYTCVGDPSACRLCGNGVHESGEECDDGNLAAADGCNEVCGVEEGFVCLGNMPSVCASVCGNGVLNAGEECDDANLDTGDGCDDFCQEESGFACFGAPSVCAATCGDSTLDVGEECDDGGTVAGDGCSPSCSVEPGFVCDASGCRLSCSNSVIDTDESCDDGNLLSSDGCSMVCQVEVGFACFNEPSVCLPTCGNAILDMGEGCDDANLNDGDGCSSTCQVEPGNACMGEPAECSLTCGDGTLDELEECDDGDLRDGDGCSAACMIEEGYMCDGLTGLCTGTCGDSVVTIDEDCDDGANGDDADGCTDLCETPDGFSCSGNPSMCAGGCGDGALAAPEGCDDGNLLDGDGCSRICQIEAAATCEGEPSACYAICGDGLVSTIEACDDGDNSSEDGCGGDCAIEPDWICVGDPSVCQNCGNGLIEGSEACDDGNRLTGDGCDDACTVEVGFECDDSMPSLCTPICGDGLVTNLESCDDGGTAAGDGCDETCAVESGYVCAGEPSECNPVCGDGLIRAAETCDDGNTRAEDGCDATCSIEQFYICENEPSRCTLDGDAFAATFLSGGGAYCQQNRPAGMWMWLVPLLLLRRRRRRRSG